MMTKGGVAVGKIESWLPEFESWLKKTRVLENASAVTNNCSVEASAGLWVLESSIYSEFGS
jgi:hypothetical protein